MDGAMGARRWMEPWEHRDGWDRGGTGVDGVVGAHGRDYTLVIKQLVIVFVPVVKKLSHGTLPGTGSTYTHARTHGVRNHACKDTSIIGTYKSMQYATR